MADNFMLPNTFFRKKHSNFEDKLFDVKGSFENKCIEKWR